LNIFIIRVLGMSTRGMKHLQFHSRHHPKTGEEESVLQLSASDVHLGKVIAKSGMVYGSAGKDLVIEGSRVAVLLRDAVRNVFRPYFSAQHPVFRVDRRIKKISTAQIVTNKVGV
uniref:50S ribosomal protein L27 n=1 Tax=Gongylonema pulchrum TaxID=637853 RepID=A0A183E2P0_9BILA